ncbi:MAG: tetratricopeptide repeat protein [Ruminococcus sp.]|nr:tetratricopeptide repeat protein [Ruminococcus sp.]
MEYCEYTNAGVVRNVNQDAVLSLCMNNSGLFVVADGMGGHTDGDVASGAVRSACLKWWNMSFMANSDMDLLSAVEGIKSALEAVNTELISRMEGTGKICGTTVAVLFIHNGAYAAMNIGDSRIYLLNKKGVRKISFDHTLNSFKEIKNIRVSKKDKLTQAIGVNKSPDWYCATDTLKGNERFFICTDGVYKYVDDDMLFSVIKNRSEEDIKEEIEKQVILNGAPDNFSFISVNPKKENNKISKKPLIIVSAIAISLFIVFAVISGIAVSGGSHADVQVTISDKLSLGQKFLIDLEYEKAVAEFNAIIEIEPKNVDAYIGLADAYIGMGDKNKAIETLEKGFSETGDETIRAKLNEIRKVEETTEETTTVIAEPEKKPVIKAINYFDPNAGAYQYNAPANFINYIYNDKGQIEKEIDGYDGRGGFSFVYNYDSDGRLLSKEQIAGWNEPMGKITLNYNESGLLVSEEYMTYSYFSEYTPRDAEKRYIIYTYDNENRIVKADYYTEEKKEYYVVMQYDEKGRIKIKQTFNANDEVLVCYYSEYDENGLIVKEIKCDSSNNHIGYVTYEYDYNILSTNTYYPHSEWGYDSY